jgi:DNA-binding response OmpR family regulator
VALAAPGEVLLVAVRGDALEAALQARGVPVRRVRTLALARRNMGQTRFQVVVVEPDLGAEDGVRFALAARSWQGWSTVPFVLLPERGDVQIVVLDGGDPVPLDTDLERLATLIAGLAW